MIQEKYVSGPVSTVKVGKENFPILYRRRYYGNGVHFTYIEVCREFHLDEAIDLGPIQTGFADGRTYRLTAKMIRELVKTCLQPGIAGGDR